MLSNKPLTIRMFFDKGDFNNSILLWFNNKLPASSPRTVENATAPAPFFDESGTVQSSKLRTNSSTTLCRSLFVKLESNTTLLGRNQLCDTHNLIRLTSLATDPTWFFVVALSKLTAEPVSTTDKQGLFWEESKKNTC